MLVCPAGAQPVSIYYRTHILAVQQSYANVTFTTDGVIKKSFNNEFLAHLHALKILFLSMAISVNP